jgi:transposase
MDWSTLDIVQASLDRHVIENMFRQSKDDDLVSVSPVRHWTDGKIRCHILTCVVALAYLRLIEIHLKRAGIPLTVTGAMDHMHKLHSCLCWHAKNRKPVRVIEKPSENQADILKAFGYQVIDGGVLQKIKE